MSHNISSSDSEDDGHSATRGKSQKEPDRVWKYECPPDFVQYQYKCSEGAELEKKRENTELWLIKAPAHFDHNSLADMKVSLSGLEMIQSTGASSKIYSVLASRSGPADLHLLTSVGKNQDASLSASSFAGVLSISESYGDCSGNQNPMPVPAAPAPSIPAGLKQRFQPFGSSTAPHLIQSTTSTCHLSPKKAKLESEEPEGHRLKKKKKKKDKHSEEERIEVPYIKQENIAYEFGELEVPKTVEEGKAERKKKKKVKKEKEDIQDKVEVDTSLITKEEQMDTSYGDNDGSVKKKKKSKKKQYE
ncbi:CD3e molecule, epsilon associated protein [Trichomycterus rosablanca]|uniref:CD3e molecule, epsilon associated protein n=1 Tax=Trichomycterus rosablanca TaxID=2290929 RepID=UPI002F35A448